MSEKPSYDELQKRVSELELVESERDKVLVALQESEDRLNLVIKGSNDAPWDWNLVSNDLYYSPQWWAQIGYTPDELPADAALWEKLMHPDDAEHVDSVFRVALEKGLTSYEVEFKLLHKDGHYVPILSRGFITRDKTGNPIRVTGTNSDVSERKKLVERVIALDKLRQQLLDSRSLEQKLLSITDEIVRIFDADFARIWVVRPGDICESGCVHANLMEDGEPMCRDRSHCLHLVVSSGRYTHTNGPHGRVPLGAYKIGRLILTGKECFITNDVVHDPQVGDHSWAAKLGLVSFVGFGLFSTEGAPIGVMGLFCKYAVSDEEVGNLTGIAATTSHVIQAGLVKKDLINARNEAEAATAAKSNFLARMSHEIRTPMNAVIGLTHLALRTELSVKQRDYLRKINGSSQALLGIINDVLDFSKIEAGKLNLDQVSFELQGVLDNLANVITLKAEEKELEVLFSLDSRIPDRLRGDPLRLGQVLINLVGNAVKFTEHGEVVIATQLLHASTDCVTIRFDVRDTGIGMSADQMAGLFESFYQVDGSITRRYGGTGLGLVISKQLVTLMGGTLQVTSDFGEGTVFSFDIPFEALAGEHVRSLAPEALHGTNVLVVDDNSTSREILSTMLQDFGLEVETASSGEEALNMIELRIADKRPTYGIILMDWKMPGLDGIETSHKIKNDQRLADIPSILMVTAYGREEVIQAAEEAGLDGFLVKPVGQSLLYNTILELLGYGNSARDDEDRLYGYATAQLNDIKGARVLLVEDNPINRQVATEFIEQAGLQIDCADNGLEGIEKVRSNQYDIVFMDIQMPVLDGLEATRRIRAAGLTELPIVAMTAHAMASDREKSLNAGMNDHLTKPIDPVKLENMLLRWIPKGDRTVSVSIIDDEIRVDDAPLVLPQIDCLDATLGVKRVGGSPQLYIRLLNEFFSSSLLEQQKLHLAFDNSEFQEAELLVHSTKGAAGSLGASQLAGIAQELEDSLRQQDQQAAAELMLLYDSALSSLCCKLEIFFTTTSNETSAAVVPGCDSAMMANLLERLIPLLEQGNSKAERLVAELHEASGDIEWAEQLVALEEAVEDVEFSEAIKIVHALQKQLSGKVI